MLVENWLSGAFSGDFLMLLNWHLLGLIFMPVDWKFGVGRLRLL